MSRDSRRRAWRAKQERLAAERAQKKDSDRALQQPSMAAVTADSGVLVPTKLANFRALFRRASRIWAVAEFAISIGAALGVLFSNGDMLIVSIGLAISWLFVFAGIMASNVRNTIAVVLCGVVLVALVAEGGILYWHFHGTNRSANETQFLPSPLTLKDLFETDFNSGGSLRLQLEGAYRLKNPFDGGQSDIPIRILTDTDGLSRFLALYIKNSPDQLFIANEMATHYKDFLNSADKFITTSIHNTGNSDAFSSSSMPFSGAIYIYTENDFSSTDKASLQQIYKSNGADKVIFRGADYLTAHTNDKREKPARVPLPNPKANIETTPPKDCPPGSTVIVDSNLGGAITSGVSVAHDRTVCIIGTKIRSMGPNVEIRDAPKK
jgi:hypothetical protein